ncbi:MAG: fibronectin type III domain-containing protein [Flavobacteriales bacterium]|jgi:hypothetical protein|nr:fibronectin type III domain-containing protein [Flavobacteriales bacterium]
MTTSQKSLSCFLLSLLTIFVSVEAFSQIGIGTTTPHSSSVLDVHSTNKGFLLPRIRHHSDISNPAEGLTIYDLSDRCINYHNGTDWQSFCSDNIAPNAILDLRVTDSTSTSISLAWSPAFDNTSTEKYFISQDGTIIDSVDAPTITYVSTGLNPNTSYEFHIRSIDPFLNLSNASNIINHRTKNIIPPTQQAVSHITASSARANWTIANTSNVSSFEIYFSTSNTAPTLSTTATIASIPNSSTYRNITGLTGYTNYYIWIRSENSSGDKSEWSGMQPVRTNIRTPYQNAITNVSANQFRVNWSTVNQASSYEVYRSSSSSAPSSTTSPTYIVNGGNSTYRYIPSLSSYIIYYSWIRSVAADGSKSSWSNRRNARTLDNIAPSVSNYYITEPAADASDHIRNISWNGLTDHGGSGVKEFRYEIYSYPKAGCSGCAPANAINDVNSGNYTYGSGSQIKIGTTPISQTYSWSFTAYGTHYFPVTGLPDNDDYVAWYKLWVKDHAGNERYIGKSHLAY